MITLAIICLVIKMLGQGKEPETSSSHSLDNFYIFYCNTGYIDKQKLEYLATILINISLDLNMVLLSVLKFITSTKFITFVACFITSDICKSQTK